MDFYSARLLYIILVEDKRAKKKNTYDDSVIVFKAQNRKQAPKRALEIGKASESEYKNSDGQQVRWVLVEIINLDRIGKEMDGCEVASRLHSHITKKPVSLTHRFHPEKSKPSPSFT